MNWKPIETAAENDGVFLAINKYGDQWLCARGSNGKIIGIGEAKISIAYNVALTATHWMPLPKGL